MAVQLVATEYAPWANEKRYWPGRRISNLIDNAIKYGGGAAVGVAVHASDRNC
jgi:hypothetical protein